MPLETTLSAPPPLTGKPIPTRFDETEETLLRQIAKVTGLAVGQVIKRAARFALPKFASGEVNILTLTDAAVRVPLDGKGDEAHE